MTLYERVKQMNLDEMKKFVYWIYLEGNKDGAENLQDSSSGYFGGAFLEMDEREVMKGNGIDSLFDMREQMMLEK